MQSAQREASCGAAPQRPMIEPVNGALPPPAAAWNQPRAADPFARTDCAGRRPGLY